MFALGNLRYLLVDVLPSDGLEKSNDILTANSDYSDAAGYVATADCEKIASESRFKCDNGECVHQNYVCDNVTHCGDNSDEKNCDGKNAQGCYSQDLDCSRPVSKRQCPNICT